VARAAVQPDGHLRRHGLDDQHAGDARPATAQRMRVIDWIDGWIDFFKI
jgi:hypothetical protein